MNPTKTVLWLFIFASLITLLNARGGGGCFLAGTPISTPNGTLNIDQLSINSKVLSFDSKGSVHASQVADVYEVERDYYYIIKSETGAVVKVTAEHPFFIGNGTFKEASLLQIGDMVFLLNNSLLSPQKISSIQKINEKVKAYNLQIDSYHTFFASGFAVHNKGGCFDGSTPVSTPFGLKPISDLKIGDSVLTFDDVGVLGEGKVTETYALISENYYSLNTESGRSVNVTAEHPFFTKNGFVETQDLQIGDEIFVISDYSNEKLVAEKITSIIVIDSPLKVYNLQVDQSHTFFANGFAVHNKGGGGGGCFLPGTQIKTDGGIMNIESVSKDDFVLSFDAQGQIRRSQVTEKYEVFRDYYYILENNLGSTVRVTAEHPFLTSTGYVETQDLEVGSETYSFDETSKVIKPSKITKKIRIDQPIVAYNLQVDKDHTFFANGYAVHNKGGGSGVRSKPYYSIEYYDCLKYVEIGTGCCERVHKSSVAYNTTPSSIKSYVPKNFVTNYGDLNCYCKSSLGAWQTSDSLPNSYGCKCTNSQHVDPSRAPICFSITNNVQDGIDLILSNINICIIAICGFILLTFKKKGKGNSEWSSTISVSKSKLDKKSQQVKTLLSTWAKADPRWNESDLTKTARATFTKLQECWSKRDYTEMAPLMMSSLYRQHISQITAMAARHEINKMDNLKILDSKIVLVKNYYDSNVDEFVIWIKATAKDTIVDDRSNKVVRGDSSNGIFEEFWTFQSQKIGKKAVWKLRQIDQPEESMSILSKENYDQISTSTGLQNTYEKTGSKGKVKVAAVREQIIATDVAVDDIKTKSEKIGRLLNFFKETDKIWDQQKMIETARSTFIEINTAIEIGNFKELEQIVVPELYATFQTDFKQLKSKGLHLEKRNLAVRNVEIVLVRNYYNNKKDEFTAWISGQAQSVLVDSKDKIVSGDGYVADFEEYWTFVRNSDKWVLQTIQKGFSAKKIISEENFDEGSSKELMDWYYTKERA